MLGELENNRVSVMIPGAGRVLVLPHGTEQSTITLLFQGVDSLVGQGGAGLLEGLETGVEIDEAELEVQ